MTLQNQDENNAEAKFPTMLAVGSQAGASINLGSILVWGNCSD